MMTNEDREAIMNSHLNRIEIRDIATPISTLHLLGTTEHNGAEVSSLDPQVFDAEANGVAINDDFISIPADHEPTDVSP
jgi:hypothetical protein